MSRFGSPAIPRPVVASGLRVSRAGALRSRAGGLVLAALSIFAGFGVATAPAAAQSVEKRVDRLEKEVRAVQRRVFGTDGVAPAPAITGGESISGDQAAGTEVRLNTLEDQLRTLTGQIEELRHKNDEQKRQLDNFIADAEFRFNALEGKGGGAGGASGSSVRSDADSAAALANESGEIVAPGAANERPLADGALPEGSTMEQYNYAYSLLAGGKYPAAEAAFRAFLDKHPKDDLAGNANYWLGQSFFVRAQYERAAKVFLEGYQAYPKSPKAPDYLLKIGISLTKIGQKPDACAVFQELQTRYPKSPAATERLAPEKKAAGCK